MSEALLFSALAPGRDKAGKPGQPFSETMSGETHDPKTPEDEAEDLQFKTSLSHRRHLEDKSSIRGLQTTEDMERAYH